MNNMICDMGCDFEGELGEFMAAHGGGKTDLSDGNGGILKAGPARRSTDCRSSRFRG